MVYRDKDIWYLFGFSCAIFGVLQTLGHLFEALLLKYLPKCVRESIRYACVVPVAMMHALYISKIIAILPFLGKLVIVCKLKIHKII